MTFGFWDNSDITWLEQQLGRFTYKPGWKMAIRPPLSEWDEPMLMVQFEAQDTYNPSRTIPIGSRDTVPYHVVRGKNEDRFADWLSAYTVSVGAARVDGVAATRRLHLQRSAQGENVTQPLVTVVIPTIKPRKGFLRRAVNSVLAQDIGGYPDPVIEIAIDREHDGSAATRNRALLKAQTPWVAFLDDDDFFLPHHLKTLLDMTQRPNPHDVYYTGCRVIGPDFEEIPRQEEWGRFGKPFDETALRNQSCLPVTSLVETEMAQRALFGPPNHDPSSPYDDWGFYLRVLEEGGRFMHFPEVTWVWHHHGRNTSGQGDRW